MVISGGSTLVGWLLRLALAGPPARGRRRLNRPARAAQAPGGLDSGLGYGV